MIAGSIALEDISIVFEVTGNLTVKYDVFEYALDDELRHRPPVRHESFEVPQDKFFKALSIAVHNDGMPDAVKDYPDAESIMGAIRWIP